MPGDAFDRMFATVFGIAVYVVAIIAMVAGDL